MIMSKKRNQDGNITIVMTKLYTQTFKLSCTIGEIYTLRYLHWKGRKTNKYVTYPKITIKPFLKKDTESNNKNKWNRKQRPFKKLNKDQKLTQGNKKREKHK